jgi:twinfilin-like protein
MEVKATDAGGKGRVFFIYTCPSGSPIKFRMVYSSGVKGIQQDAKDKAGVEIAAKVCRWYHMSRTPVANPVQLETSDISDLTESHLKSSLPSKPIHASSLPTFSGGMTPAFGRPHPTIGTTNMPGRSASTTPLPASGPSTPATPSSATAGEGEDGKESIRKAFDAFGPRVGGGGGGFARPKPAGRR